MEIKEIRKLLDPQFGYWAKSTGELLYVHHFAVYSIFTRLSRYIPSLDKKEKILLEIACLIHDIGKMKSEIQQDLRTGKKPTHFHKVTSSEEVKKYLQKVGLKFKEEDIKKITDIIRTHHGVSGKDLTEINTSGAGFYTFLLSTADYIASMERVSYETINKLKRLYKDKIEFTVVEYFRFPSPTANLIVKKIVEAYNNNGWEQLCFPENGVIFIGKPKTSLPSKDEVIKSILHELIQQLIKEQTPVPQRADREHLVLLSREFPEEFLKIHKDSLIDSLGNIDTKGFVFLKFWKEIVSLYPNIEKKVENDKIFKLLKLASGSSGRCKVEAKSEYHKIFKIPSPDNSKEILLSTFGRLKVKDIKIKDVDYKIDERANLKDLRADLLFKLLYSLAYEIKKNNNEKVKKSLKKFLDSMISMEEEIDFKNIAKEIFEKYKEYKKTSVAEKGCCERCGCPIAFKMQPTLNIAKDYRAPQSFSQIKSKYAYRSICPFCAYDNFILRKGIKGNKVRIFLRLQTKIPDLLVNYEELKILINRLCSGVKNPRSIIKFKEREEIRNLPFPERIEIPVSRDSEIKDVEILISENGILVKLEDIKYTQFSSKDMKAKYEPLYHVMQLLGFKVAIGREEQEDLFGEKIETNDKNYYKSLATILLSKLNEKKQKKYIFSRNLMEKSPSLTIKIMGDSVADKNIPEGLIKCLLKSMIKTKIIIAKTKRR